MRVRPGDDIGAAIWRLGVYDLPLSEAIWRLLDQGEVCLDAGANIGYTCGLMAARSGPSGRVIAFEPHPRIYSELVSTVSGWANERIARITPIAIALSSTTGSAFLQEPVDFIQNRGIARIVAHECSGGFWVATRRLDDLQNENAPPRLIKLDVEGHELEVLLGAQRLLESGLVRDIIFEEHSRSFLAPVPMLLERLGYSIFALSRRFSGPLLAARGERHPVLSYLPTNFLATRDPKRAKRRFRAHGWQVLRGAPDQP
jgi:FkbM family methyltransferase